MSQNNFFLILIHFLFHLFFGAKWEMTILKIQNPSSKMLRKLIPQNNPSAPPRKDNFIILFLDV
jgi:hypothetical protein